MIREVVAEVWRLFLARFWRTLLIVALVLAPLELGIAIVDPGFSSGAAGWWAWVGITAAITLIVFPWMLGALVHDVANEDRTVIEPYTRTRGHLRDLILSALATTAGIAIGMLALIVPGLILFARWALVVPLIVLEGAPWRAALSRSNELVRGRTAAVLTIFLVLSLIAVVLVAVPAVVGYIVLGGVLGAWVATMAIDTVLIAFYAFTPFVLYRRFQGERLQSVARCGVV